MKAVIYARYSPGPNQTDKSIEGQIRECTQFAQQNDIAIVGKYADHKKTGRNDNRADFQRMLKDSARGLFDAVIVWKIDRFGRNREEIAINKVKLRKNGVRVMYAKEHIPDGPEGIILESTLEGLAEYYSANLSQNIMRGMREVALKGQSTGGGGRSLGYYVDQNKRFQIDEHGAQIVRQIFEAYSSGKQASEIIKELNDKGLKTANGKPFNHNSITRILANRRYIGEYRWHDILIPDGMPRIIDDETFERVQKRLEKNKKAPARKIQAGSEEEFLLTTKLFCGHCGATMIGDSGTGKSGKKYSYYTCSTRKRRKDGRKCDKKSVRKDELERYIVEQTVAHVLVDDVIEYIADKVVELQRKELQDTSMLDYYKSSLRDTEKSLKNIVAAIEQGIFTPTTKDRLLELEAEKADLEINIQKEEIIHPTFSREQIIFFLERFRGGDVDDPEYQRQIIDTFISRVWLYDDKMVVTYNYSGDGNTVTLEVAEKAASEAVGECSDKFPPSPPHPAVRTLRAAGFLLPRQAVCLRPIFFVSPFQIKTIRTFPQSGTGSDLSFVWIVWGYRNIGCKKTPSIRGRVGRTGQRTAARQKQQNNDEL